MAVLTQMVCFSPGGGVHSRLDSELDSRLDSGLDSKLDSRLDSRQDSWVEIGHRMECCAYSGKDSGNDD